MKNVKTAMDKKIDELNEKAGRVTGIDIKAIGKELYNNKPYMAGVYTFGSLFILTSTGFLTSLAISGIASFGYSRYLKRDSVESEVK